MSYMTKAVRRLGSGLSLLGTLFQLGVVVAAMPEWRPCIQCGLPDPALPPEAVDTWRPFIENPGPISTSQGREPPCPEPQGRGDAYDLIAAPLPDGYDPHGFGRRQIHACVLVGAEGEVLAARMLRGTGRPGLDRHLVGTIRRSWRFRPVYWADESRSWQRVRLNSGPVEGSAHYPLLLY